MPLGTLAPVTPRSTVAGRRRPRRGRSADRSRGTVGAVARPGRIRLYGPLVSLAVPAATLGLALAVWVGWSCAGTACVRPSLAVWGLVLLAAPTALLAGMPWFTGPISLGATAVSSLALWVGCGRWAARRATADVDAGWRAYWAELGFLVGGIWAGVLVGLAGMGLFFTL